MAHCYSVGEPDTEPLYEVGADVHVNNIFYQTVRSTWWSIETGWLYKLVDDAYVYRECDLKSYDKQILLRKRRIRLRRN